MAAKWLTLFFWYRGQKIGLLQLPQSLSCLHSLFSVELPEHAFLVSFPSPRLAGFCSCRIRSCVFLRPPAMHGSGAVQDVAHVVSCLVLSTGEALISVSWQRLVWKTTCSTVSVLLSAYIFLSLMFDIMGKMQRRAFCFGLRLCKSNETGAKRARM